LSFVHHPVLLEETVELLRPGPGKLFVDGTLGGGSHSEALLKSGAEVWGIDRDPVALNAAMAKLSRFKERFRAVRGNYAEVLKIAGDQQVDGFLLDLGISSPQVDDPSRGFSFQVDGPLDMRMGDSGETAAELVARVPEPQLAALLRDYGEEPFAKRIARELKATLPQRTLEAANAVKRAVPKSAWPKNIHVATRTFQALRMAVNQELEGLHSALCALPQLLKAEGRAVVISFHSLEDRMVKEHFKKLQGQCVCPPRLPVCGCGARGTFKLLTKKAVQAKDAEREENRRARSARLRAVEKVR
jgi:16S rRNA (cytosine1402-N4)-methyltransferase